MTFTLIATLYINSELIISSDKITVKYTVN